MNRKGKNENNNNQFKILTPIVRSTIVIIDGANVTEIDCFLNDFDDGCGGGDDDAMRSLSVGFLCGNQWWLKPEFSIWTPVPDASYHRIDFFKRNFPYAKVVWAPSPPPNRKIRIPGVRRERKKKNEKGLNKWKVRKGPNPQKIPFIGKALFLARQYPAFKIALKYDFLLYKNNK